MARGGPRPGSGRPIGVPNKATLEKAELARLAAAEAKAEGRKLPKEQLYDFATLLGGIAAAYQPVGRTPDGEPLWRKPDHEAKFEKWAAIAFPFMKEAAPYYSPTFKAIMLAPTTQENPGDRNKVMKLTIFDHSGALIEGVALKDEVEE